MEIFRASPQRGRLYTTADLDAAVRNFAALSNWKSDKVRQKHTNLSGQQLSKRISLREYVSLSHGAFAAFSEVKAMPMPQTMEPEPQMGTAEPQEQEPQHDREELCDRMAEHGANMDVMKDAPPHVMAEVVRICDAKDEEHKPAVHPMDEEDEENWKEPEDEEEKKKFRENVRKWAERAPRLAKKFGEYNEPMEKDEEEKMAKMSETDRAVYKAIEAYKKQQSAEIAQLHKFREETVAQQKSLTIETFCESMAQAGKLAPTEFMPRKGDKPPTGTTYHRLLRADARSKVVKFSDGDKTVEDTELAAQMAEIRRRRSAFVERFKDAPLGKEHEDAHVEAIVQKFSEHEEAFRRMGQTEEKLVSAYKAERERNPKLTADQFLNR